MTGPAELEICVESLQACMAAETGGADRIELCSALDGGGVTPSRGFIHAAVTSVRLPMHVLLRPRNGNFIYSEAEFAILCDDLQDALSLGAAGIVTGVLQPDGEIDTERTALLVRLAHGRPVTFHRAFDRLTGSEAQLERVIDTGCQRLLTSGGRSTVTEGIDMLGRLAQQARGRIRIAAGGGVNLHTAAQLARIPGLDLHASLRRTISPQPDSPADPLWQQAALDGSIRSEDVAHLRAILHSSRDSNPSDEKRSSHHG